MEDIDQQNKFIAEFKNRAEKAHRFCSLILGGIFFVILGGIITTFLLADWLTSNEVSSINKHIRSIVKDEGDLTANMTAALTHLNHNIDAFDKTITNEGISRLSEGCFEADKEDYTIYGDARGEFFFGKSDLKEFFDKRISHIKPRSNAKNSDIIVITLDFSLTGDKPKVTKLGCNNPSKDSLDTATQEDIKANHYFWAINRSDLDRIRSIIDDISFDDVNSSLKDSLIKRDEYIAEIAALNRLKELALKEEVEKKGPNLTEKDSSNISDGGFILQLNLNKLGIISIITLVTGLMFSVYRYNKRLEVYYTAIYDSLQMSPVPKSMSFSALLSAFAPMIEFETLGKPRIQANLE